ncbi:MAG: cytochrome c maturation protein CcmE [Bilophila wadsworthia]
MAKIRQERLSRGTSPVLGGVGYLAYSGFSENSVYFLNVSEALYPSDKLKAARLFGTVAEDGLSRSKPAVTSSSGWRIRKTRPPRCGSSTGAIPDTFKAGAEVIVEGGLRPDGSFQAKTLMTKCPSKYQKENRG